MTKAKPPQDVAEVVRPNPLVAAVLAAAFAGATAVTIYAPIQSPLVRNWVLTFAAGSGLLLLVFWIFPKWAPKINRYVWTEAKSVSVTYSASVALVSCFGAMLVSLLLLFIGQWRYPTMTRHWPALWSIGLVSALVPLLIVIYLGLVQAGAIKHFRWLAVSRLLMTTSNNHFNDRGRLFILVVATVEIAMIQGAVVVTGGLSISPFSVLLVLAGTVAAIASERPIYAIVTVLLACQAAAATEIIGSYAPPATDFYPAAHIVVIIVSMVVGLLIDLGRKSRPVRPRLASQGRSMQ